jgi:chaperonin cofactor prefoldin
MTNNFNNNILYTPPVETSHYDLRNQNGDLLCHVVKCRRHTKLHEESGGLFCNKCLKKIKTIRQERLRDTTSFEKLQNDLTNMLHTPPPTKISHYDLRNQNGDLLCHGVKCRRHTKLNEQFGGLFCNKCLEKIKAIREKILHDTTSFEKLKNEIEARREEVLFRKVMEPGHMHYLLTLEKRLSDLDVIKKID